MSARAHTPLQDGYNSIPQPNSNLVSRGYGTAYGIDASDSAPTGGKPNEASPLSQSVQRTNSMYSYRNGGDDLDSEDRGYTTQQLEGAGLHRTASHTSSKGIPSRSNTLKKQKSLSRKTSLKRSGSRKSLNAGSIKGVSTGEKQGLEEYNSVFYTPVPTTGTPTEILANRFQAWRKFLKDIIAYFREIQSSYETRGKALLKVSNVVNNTSMPTIFMTEGGLNEANRILRDYHKQAVVEANKARDIENDVITQLSGLRADLAQKIKEIKSLSGDFKNNVEKEKDHTRKSVNILQDALQAVDTDPHSITGKDDPYIIRLNVDRQVERQVDEENYLHRAYLNLEGSGRELESIVVGEIQKAYNAFAGILKREADGAYETIDHLRQGPITLPKDYEWSQFVEHDPHFVSPDTPVRKVEDIEYPGRNHPAAAEVRAGMLERKSKYLKSYTPGWYVLSPTHLHEFKSAERIYTQPPVMSLLLSDQKLGSRSQPGSSSHKFILKGRQTGTMHRGHSWVFRAESYDTMLAWYDDIQNLTEKTGEERNAFVRKHARSFSGNSLRGGGSDSGMEEDEADAVPYSANASMTSKQIQSEPAASRPQPGGRFPSDLQVSRHLQAPLSPSSGSSIADHDLTTAAGGLQGGAGYYENQEYHGQSNPTKLQRYAPTDTAKECGFPALQNSSNLPQSSASAYQQQDQTAMNQVQTTQSPSAPVYPNSGTMQPDYRRHESNYKDWMTPAAGGAFLGASGGGTEEYWRNRRKEVEEHQQMEQGTTALPQRMKELSAQNSEKASSPSAMTDSTAPTSLDRGETIIPIVPIIPLSKVTTTSPTTINSPPPNPPNFGPSPTPVVASKVEAASSTAAALSPATTVVSTFPETSASLTSEKPTGSQTHTQYDTNAAGAVNAHPTGHIFPSVLRHDTNTSISDLHIPGEFKFAN